MAAVISDASPLVHLAAIKQFELLKQLYSLVFIPKAVWTEVAVQLSDDIKKLALKMAGEST